LYSAMTVISVPARGCRSWDMSVVVSANEIGRARLGIDLRAAAPGIEIGFDLAGSEAHFDFMNSLQNDAHVLTSSRLMEKFQKSAGRSTSLTRGQALSSPNE
jgi:hypothetical protein